MNKKNSNIPSSAIGNNANSGTVPSLESTQEILNGELHEKIESIKKNRKKRAVAQKKFEKKYLLLRNIAYLVCITLVTGLVLSIASLKRVTHQNQLLQNDILRLEKRNETVLADLEAIKNENDTLVQKRIPGLTPIKYDDPFKMERQALKSIVFTRTQFNETTKYEFLAVVRNTSLELIRPSCRILFFNNRGIQVGEGNITAAEHYSGQVNFVTLKPGESQSFTGTIQITIDDEPGYFMVIYENTEL